MDTVTEHVLTAHDTRALRHADALCFDHHPDGTGAIRAIMRAENSDTGFEQTHTIPVTSRVENYGPSRDAYKAWHGFIYAKSSHEAQTLIRHMRVGKRVHLRWTSDNASPVLVDAGVVRDELRIRIGDDKHADTYLVAVQVGLDNTARMVRGA